MRGALACRAVTGDQEPREAAERETQPDDDALVERLREEVDAARERVSDAWRRYRDKARGDGLAAIAGSPLLPALLALVQQQA
jgi:hypothetical protein